MASGDQRDITEYRVTMKFGHLLSACGSLIVVVAVCATGWWSLKNDVASASALAQDAKTTVEVRSREIQAQVAHMSCLMEQQTQYQIYGVKPNRVCE
jgi:hypothetical protein